MFGVGWQEEDIRNKGDRLYCARLQLGVISPVNNTRNSKLKQNPLSMSKNSIRAWKIKSLAFSKELKILTKLIVTINLLRMKLMIYGTYFYGRCRTEGI